MKNTRTNITGKIIASAIAAVMMMTTAASIAASADSYTGYDVENTYNLTVDDAVDLSTELIFTGIEEYVPGGKLLMPFVKLFANDLMGKGKELTLDDINARMDDMFKKLDDLNENIDKSTEKITAIQNFTNSQYHTFNSQIAEIVNQIQRIRTNEKLTENQKLAAIGALIGNNFNWTSSNSVIISFRQYAAAVNRPCIGKSETIFDTIYNYNKKNAMFAGEALDLSAEANELIMTDLYAGYLALMECMSAQLKVCNMTPEERAEIDPYVLSLNSKSVDQNTVRDRINEFTQIVMGNMNADGTYDNSGIIGKYNSLYNDTYRLTFINKDTTEIPVSPVLTVSTTADFGKNKKYMALACDLTDGVNSNIVPKMGLSGGQIRDIAAFIKGKNITLREYLRQNGFEVDNVNKHGLIITEKSYNDRWSAGNVAKASAACEEYHAFIKDIDIDVKNPSEEETFLCQAGHNTIFYSYNYRYDKALVTFNKC